MFWESNEKKWPVDIAGIRVTRVIGRGRRGRWHDMRVTAGIASQRENGVYTAECRNHVER